jgi:N-acyl-D-amino-acid deacylase
MIMLRTVCCLFLLALACALPAAAQPVLLKNVLIYDGTGRPPYRGDVRIKEGRIAAVGRNLKPEPGETVRDERGLALAPGFIDMHSHADRLIFELPLAENAVRQGITTVLVGQDGGSMFPAAEFLARLEKHRAAVNVATMAGHGTLRRQVLKSDILRPSTQAELDQMRQLLRDEMRAGAFGLSTGLEYDEGQFATTDEVVALARVAAGHDGFYITHVRDEGNNAMESFREAIEIGRRARLPVVITHIKLATTPVWQTATTELPQIFSQALRQGVDLKADVYPYTYWQSSLRVIVLDRDYFNPQKVERAIAENGGAARIHLARYGPEPEAAGQTLDAVAQRWGVTPVEAFMRIVRTTMPQPDGARGEEGVIVASMHEDDLRWFLAHPRIMFSSDGGLRDRHPRGAGAFPRILGEYVREQGVLRLETAIHKMTAMPAAQLGLRDRGRIAPGFYADLVLFDPARIRDRATVEEPEAPAEGIDGVMVNGLWVLDGGKMTGARPGAVLRGPGYRRPRSAEAGDAPLPRAGAAPARVQ